MRARPARDTADGSSPTVDPGGQFTHRPLVGAGVADHHRYAVRVAALDQRHAAVAARLAVRAASGEGTLGPGQVLLPAAVQMTYWTPHGPKRMRRLVAHLAQDQACAVGVAEQRGRRAAVGDLKN